MTSLTNLNIGGTDLKTAAVSFSIRKKVCYTTMFSGKFIKSIADALNTPATNDDIYVEYTDSIGAYKKFWGKVRSVTPNGNYYLIEATTKQARLDDFGVNSVYASATNSDVIASDMMDATLGPGFTVTNTVSSPASISTYTMAQTTSADQLRKLMWYRTAADGSPMIWRMDDTFAGCTINTMALEDLGDVVPSTDISINVTNGNLLSTVEVSDITSYITNIITTSHGGGRHVSNDTDNVSTATSRGTYGSKTASIYRPEINTLADSVLTENNILRYYQDAKAQYKFTAREQGLHGNATHYPVINTLYTVVDPISGTTYADVPCIEETHEWPKMQSKLVLGAILPDFTSYLSTNSSTNDRIGQDSAGRNCCFKVRLSAAQAIATGGSLKRINFDTEDYDIGGGFDNATNYRFNAPISGIYHFEGCAKFSSALTAGTDVTLGININGTYVAYNTIYAQGTNTPSANASCTVQMTAGQYAQMEIYHNYGSNRNISNGVGDTMFMGNLISSV